MRNICTHTWEKVKLLQKVPVLWLRIANTQLVLARLDYIKNRHKTRPMVGLFRTLVIFLQTNNERDFRCIHSSCVINKVGGLLLIFFTFAL